MDAVVWTDYICPWCYLGYDRTALMRRLGVNVTTRPYELHPDLPIEGRPVRPAGRLSQVFDHIAAECDELGIPFRPPRRTPNSRRALETAELVRMNQPEAFDRLDDSLFRAHWVDGLDLGDVGVLRDLVDAAGADSDQVEAFRDRGRGREAVDRSMNEARDAGVTATPSWLVGDGLLIPGAQPRETIERWITRLRDRAEENERAGRIAP